MADKLTTLRSDYYRRRKPVVGEEAKDPELSELQPSLELPEIRFDKNAPFFFTAVQPSERRERLIETNPWLKSLLGKVAAARYKLMSGDDELFNSKKYGWGEHYVAPPDADEYFDWARDENGKLVAIPKDAAVKLKSEQPEEYERRAKPFMEYDEDKMFHLLPMTREDAEAEHLPWYSSTNDYLNALLSTRLGDQSRDDLYELADIEYRKELAKQNLSREDFDKLYESGSFKPKNAFSQGVKTFLAPVSQAVAGDPELYKKTSPAEMAARGLADIGLNAATVAIPWGTSARVMALTGRPIAGRLAGGALGGLASYGIERGANEGFDRATGYGTDNMPIDLTDAGLAAILGAATGGGMTTNRARGLRDLKRTMNPRNPETVRPSDIKSSFEATDVFTGAKKDKGRAARHHASMSFDEYNKAYPDAATSVQMAPKLEARGIPLAVNLPEGNLTNLTETPSWKQLGLQTKYNMGTGSNYLYQTKTKPHLSEIKQGRFVDLPNDPNAADMLKRQPKFETVSEDVNIPRFWRTGDNDEFVKSYVSENPEYFAKGFSAEDLHNGLKSVAKSAQTRGSKEAKYFTGKTKVFPDKDLAAMRAEVSGNTVDDAARRHQGVLRDILMRNTQPGQLKKGRFVPADSKQQKAYDKANKTFRRRSEQNTVSRSQFKQMSENKGGSVAAKAATLILSPALNNVVPLGSNVVRGIQPIEYED